MEVVLPYMEKHTESLLQGASQHNHRGDTYLWTKIYVRFCVNIPYEMIFNITKFQKKIPLREKHEHKRKRLGSKFFLTNCIYIYIQLQCIYLYSANLTIQLLPAPMAERYEA